MHSTYRLFAITTLLTTVSMSNVSCTVEDDDTAITEIPKTPVSATVEQSATPTITSTPESHCDSMVIPGVAFRAIYPANRVRFDAYEYAYSMYMMEQSESSDYGRAVYPLQFKNGTRIESIDVSGFFTTDHGSMSLSIVRVSQTSTSVWSTGISATAPGSYVVDGDCDTPSMCIVDNTQYAYLLQVELNLPYVDDNVVGQAYVYRVKLDYCQAD